MPEYLRRSAFNNITKVSKVGSKSEEEFDLEAGLNLLFFYNALDKGEFAGRENDWVTVYNQRIIEYGQMYDDETLNYILKTKPGAVQIPVDQTKLPRSPPARLVTVQRVNNGEDYKIRVRVRRPNENLFAQINYDFYDTQRNNKLYTCVLDTGAQETILPYYVKETLGTVGWSSCQRMAGGYGYPALMIGATDVFMVSIGDDNNWTKWVPAKIQVWEEYPGNQVGDALVGNDVTDQLAYLHEPVNPIKFLDVRDEVRLTTFVGTCS